MSEETNIPDILTNDTANYRSAMPLLPKDDYTLKVKSVELVESKKHGPNTLVKIKLATTEDTRSADGKETLKAGYPIFDQISLVPTDDYPRESIERKVKQFRHAVTGQPSGGFYPLEQYNGGTVKAAVNIQAAKDGFDEKNNVSRYIVPKE